MLQDLTVNTIAGILAGIVITYLHVYLLRRDNDREPKKLVLDIKNKVYRPAPIVFIFALALLQLSWSVITIALIPLVHDTWLTEVYIADVPLVVFVLLFAMGVAMLFVSIYMHHRLPKINWWLYLVLITCTYTLAVTEASLFAGDFPTIEDAGSMFLMLAVTAAIFLPLIYAGRYVAIKTQQEFTMLQLFKHLTKQDKSDLIEIVDSLPSVKNKK